MKNKKIFFSSIVIVGLLLIGTFFYFIFQEDNPYQYYTGLGDNFDLASNDEKIVFSYFKDGKEAIFSADQNGKNVKRLTPFGSLRHHQPKLSPDSSKLLYLAKNKEGIDALYVANSDGTNPKKIVSDKMHVTNALFASSNDTIYFTAKSAEDFKKAEEANGGEDIYSINLDGTNRKQLTDKDYFSIDYFLLSPNGKELYYRGDSEHIDTIALEKEGEKNSLSSKLGIRDSYQQVLSPDGSKMAYTAVSKESETASLYEYELFLFDVESEKTNKLTNLKTSVTVPQFFHKANKIAFLEHTNWPDDPAKYRFTTIDIDSKKLEKITLDMPKSTASSHWMMKTINGAVNGITISILYILFVGLITMYQVYFRAKKGYLPSIISLSFTIVAFIASFVVAMTVDPWSGIAIAMLAAGLLGCTVLLFIFVFVLNMIKKRKA